MEVEASSKPSGSQNKPGRARRSKAICWGWAISGVLIVGLIILILALTVFKAKRPKTTVNSVSLSDFHLSFDVLRLRVLLNVSLDADISVNNPNRVAFRYDSSSAFLKYRGQVVGEAPLPAGKIGARQTVPMNITLTLMADRLLSDSHLYSDVMSGTLPLTTYTRVSGYVRILFKIHVVSYSTCDVYVDVTNRNLVNQTCHYRTKL